MNEYTLTNLKFPACAGIDGDKIHISGGHIEEIGAFSGIRGNECDCGGLTALPSLVDNHVHFREPGAEEKEDFASGSAAAAHGGVGMVLEVQNSLPLLTTPELVRAKREIVSRKSCVDVAFYASAVRETLSHMDEMAAQTAGFKLFMAPSHADEGYDNEEAMRPFFSHCARLGSLLIVHAEDGRLIGRHAEGLDPNDPADFSSIRSPAAEIHAVECAINVARDCGTRLHIFHVTTAGAVDLIADARTEGVDVSASTCPHYLFFTDADTARYGSRLKVFPSIKSEHNRKRLFDALREGIIEIVSTDHAPHRPEEKRLPFAKSPAGISSVDLLLPLMTTLVARGEFSLDDVVALCASNPARIHRLIDKGAMKTGWPADLAIIDLEKRWTVEEEDFLSRASVSPYVGLELQGRVAATLARGRPVFVDRAGRLADAFSKV